MPAEPLKDIRGSEGAELQGKKIALCVTGSVAVIRSPEIARELMRHGAEVYAVTTPAAQKIIHPNILEWATGNPVVTELTGRTEHILLAGDHPGKVDVVLIAPCTANTVGKIAAGIDDSPVTTIATLALGGKIPLLIAPGMHEPMYTNPLVIGNINRLKDLGVTFIEPRLEEGKAKLAETEDIMQAVIHQLAAKDLAEKQVLVTAGPTREYIDPVRIITNRSSGKMGIALAQEALRRGAQTTLILGPSPIEPPKGLKVVRVETTQQLYDATAEELKATPYDLVVAAGAPVDFTPEHTVPTKIPSGRRPLQLRLKPTPKIIGLVKRLRSQAFLIGFKAEHNVPMKTLLARGRSLMREARADVVVVNDVGKVGVGFEAEENEVYVLDAQGRVTHLPRASKGEIARRVLDLALQGMKA